MAGQAAIAIQNAQQHEELLQERDGRANAEISSAMADLSGKMVHRMRNHLGGIRSDVKEIEDEYLSNIRRDIETSPSLSMLLGYVDDIEDMLGDVEQETESALEMLDKLRRPFKVEPGPVNVNESIHHALRDLHRSPQVPITISETIATLPRVTGSLEHMSEVFHILLTNSIAATSEGGQINVTCSPIRNTKIKVTVVDTGIGMSNDVLSQIFNYGFTTKTTKKESAGGYGFGLWWVKTYLQRKEIGGDIDVQSTPGRGSQFTLTLPVWLER